MKHLILVLAMYSGFAAKAQKFELSLLKNLDTLQASFIQHFTVFKDRMYYRYGFYNMYSTDGTDQGTRAFAKGKFWIARDFAVAGDNLFFVANDPVYGEELWISDGTDSGTRVVKDIYPGVRFSGISNLVPVGNILYFQGNDSLTGSELWRTDGTPAGTYLVRDLFPGIRSSLATPVCAYKGQLLLEARDSTHAYGLYLTDGTDSGTTLLRRVIGTWVLKSKVIEYNGKLYFSGFDDESGSQVWVSDGTRPGTRLFKRINPAESSSPSSFVLYNNRLCFTANDGKNGHEIWCTDGTESGTVMITSINPHLLSFAPRELTVFKDRLFFLAFSNISGWEVWSTAIFPQSATLLKDLAPDGTPVNAKNLNVFSNRLFFIADNDKEQCQLWYSDGTENETQMVPRPSGTNGKNPLCNDNTEFKVFRNALYFPAVYNSGIFEVWRCTEAKADIGDIHTGNEFRVYPNPVSNELRFPYPVHGIVMDISGRRLLEVNGLFCDVSRLDEGMYVVRNDEGFAAMFLVER